MLTVHESSREIGDSDSMLLVLISDLPIGDAMDQVAGVVDEILAIGDAYDDDLPDVAGPYVTERGPVVFFNGVYDADAVDVVIDLFAEYLRRAGAAGRIERYRQVFPAITRQREADFFECRLALPGTGQLLGALTVWAIPGDVMETAYATAVDWCAELTGGGEVYVEMGMACFACTPALARDLLSVSLQHGPGAAYAAVIAERSSEFRLVSLNFAQGHASFVSGRAGPNTDWASHLGVTKDVLVAAARWPAHGFIKRGSNFDSINNYALEWDWLPMPHLDLTTVRSQRELEDQHALDAFGIQSVPIAVAGQQLPEELWVVSPLSETIVLLEHRDLAAWYAAPRPDAETLDQARRDLAAMFPPPNTAHTRPPFGG